MTLAVTGSTITDPSSPCPVEEQRDAQCIVRFGQGRQETDSRCGQAGTGLSEGSCPGTNVQPVYFGRRSGPDPPIVSAMARCASVVNARPSRTDRKSTRLNSS